MTSPSPFRADTAVLLRRRGVAMVATLLVHAVLLFFVLWGRGARPDTAPVTPALAVFDVALPPPPPVPIPPPPPPPPPPPVSRTDAGGSAGRARTLPRQAIIRAPEPPPRADMLAMEASLGTPVARAAPSDLLALPDIAAGSGGGSERGGAGGRGEGRGSGTGNGSGNGSGRGVGLAAALWIKMPSVADMEPYWPTRARRERIAGRVVLACIVPRPGPPRRCTVINEYPQGIGFGASAVRMSRLFRIKPVTRGTATEDMPVIVPVSFGTLIEIKLPAKAG